MNDYFGPARKRFNALRDDDARSVAEVQAIATLALLGVLEDISADIEVLAKNLP